MAMNGFKSEAQGLRSKLIKFKLFRSYVGVKTPADSMRPE